MNKIAIVLVLALLAGCANQSPSARMYTYGNEGQALVAQKVQFGQVLDVEKITLQPTKPTGIGAIVGMIAGGGIGNLIGMGVGNTIAIALGGIGGGVAGASIEQKMMQEQGYVITVKLDSGKMIAVSQAIDVEVKRGDRIQVLERQGVYRIFPKTLDK